MHTSTIEYSEGDPTNFSNNLERTFNTSSLVNGHSIQYLHHPLSY